MCINWSVSLKGDYILDLTLLITYVIGGPIIHFLLTYLGLHSRKGMLYEIWSKRKHPYRFTLWIAICHSGTGILIYLSQQYFGIVMFALFLLIGFFGIVFSVKLWNLDKKEGWRSWLRIPQKT